MRLLTGGKRPTNTEVINNQRWLAPVGVVLTVGSASLFVQNGLGTRAVFVNKVRRRDEKPVFDPWSCLLVAGLPPWPPGAKKEVMLKTACVSQSGP